MDSETQEIIDYFLSESRDTLQEVEPLLIELEGGQAPGDEGLAAIFRLFHSMKGTAGFLEFQSIERVTHSAENILQRLREGSLELDQNIIDALCETLDFINDRLDCVERTGSDSGAESQADALSDRLGHIVLGDSGAGPSDEEQGASEERVAETHFGASLGLSFQVNQEVVQQFIGEAEDLLGDVEAALLAMDEDAISDDELSSGYRSLHSFKGNGGFLGFVDLEALSHTAENIFSALKDGEYGATPDLIAAMFATLDELKGAVRKLPEEQPTIPGLAEVQARLEQAGEAARSARAGGAAAAPEAPPVLEVPEMPELVAPVIEAPAPKKPAAPPPAKPVAAAPAKPVAAAPAKPAAAAPKKPAPAPKKVAPPEPDLSDADASRQDGQKGQAPKRRDTLRVDVEKLDLLMDLVGELIIGTTSVIHNQDVAALELESFQKSAMQLNRITRDLQDVAMSLRMVPIDATFRKMIRLVRDVSRKQGKQVHLAIEGAETEVDKTVAEIIADPLVHLMRNAIDHGIEDEDARRAAGKPAEAHLGLSARHQGGEIWITVSDDGRGLDRKKLLAKARDRGLPEAFRDDLSDAEVFSFIFAAGFSTASTVTDISGRGIGMDVVKRNIERVGGRIDIESTAGRGSAFTLRIPLTLAIIEGMLMRVGPAYFTIPLLQIRESVVLTPKQITTLSNGQEVARIRNQLLPVLRLHDFYGLTPDAVDMEDGIFVIVEDGDQQVCMFVDQLVGQRQTVVKSLSGYLGDIRGLSGCTVLGDGQISLIIDVQNLLQNYMRGAA
jgi:two-component system chemotaxis sensor kinase CheA